jgi:hypothetical protein
MKAAYDPSKSYREGYAAEIRAIADWLVPEETTSAWTRPRMERQSERLNLRQTLLAEADRAEAGE